uniref:Uncharacterized protein n=1 Tax=Aegilops tauschii subsp. strangulata TaxID=200361 RepID=A0A453D763_AEGTS
MESAGVDIVGVTKQIYMSLQFGSPSHVKKKHFLAKLCQPCDVIHYTLLSPFE